MISVQKISIRLRSTRAAQKKKRWHAAMKTAGIMRAHRCSGVQMKMEVLAHMLRGLQ